MDVCVDDFIQEEANETNEWDARRLVLCIAEKRAF
jgi:hypothetical protein